MIYCITLKNNLACEQNSAGESYRDWKGRQETLSPPLRSILSISAFSLPHPRLDSLFRAKEKHAIYLSTVYSRHSSLLSNT